MKRDERAAVKSLDRGLDILEYVAEARQAPTFSRFLADLGIPRSSLSHLLNNLQARGYIERDPATEGYRLGASIARLAKQAPQPSLEARIAPVLQQLSQDVNETCGFYVRVGGEAEVVESAISTQALSYTMKKGARAPLHAVSAGKLFLAELTPEELKDYLDDVVLEPVTPQTIRSKARLKQEIQSVRAAGFAYSREEFTPGISAIAIAVRHNDTLVGALNIAVPSVRFTPERDAGFRDALRVAAKAIVAALD